LSLTFGHGGRRTSDTDIDYQLLETSIAHEAAQRNDIPYSNSEDYRYQFFGYDITYRAIMRSPTHINIGTYFFVGLMVVIPLKEILVSGGSYG
jgi:hypothetical protein